MQKPLISVIMPVYNAENRLDMSIKSILNQSYRNIELILVNDGSKDRSRDICLKYADFDSRVILINQGNAGVSIARNRGIDEASGDYITFVDSDDIVDESAYEVAVKECIKSDADMVVFGMSFEYYKADRFIKKREISFNQQMIIEVGSFKNYFFELFEKNYLSSVWNKVIKASIIKSHNIKFNKNMSILEDFKYVLDVLNYTSKIVILDDVFYQYYNDMTMSSFSRRPNIDYMNNFRILDTKLRDFAREIGLTDEVSNEKINCMIIRFYIITLEKIFSSNATGKEKLSGLRNFIYDNQVEKASKHAKCNGKRLVLVNLIIKQQNLVLLYILFSFNNLKNRIRLRIYGDCYVKETKV